MASLPNCFEQCPHLTSGAKAVLCRGGVNEGNFHLLTEATLRQEFGLLTWGDRMCVLQLVARHSPPPSVALTAGGSTVSSLGKAEPSVSTESNGNSMEREETSHAVGSVPPNVVTREDTEQLCRTPARSVPLYGVLPPNINEPQLILVRLKLGASPRLKLYLQGWSTQIDRVGPKYLLIRLSDRNCFQLALPPCIQHLDDLLEAIYLLSADKAALFYTRLTCFNRWSSGSDWIAREVVYTDCPSDCPKVGAGLYHDVGLVVQEKRAIGNKVLDVLPCKDLVHATGAEVACLFAVNGLDIPPVLRGELCRL